MLLAGVVAAQTPPDAADSRFDVGMQIRVRGEVALDEDTERESDDSRILTRVRASLAVRAHERVRFYVQGQDSRYPWVDPDNQPNGDRPRSTVRQAYVDLGGADDGWSLRAGRQVVSYGSERLFAERRWSNVSPTWDGARLRLGRGDSGVDLFGYRFAHLAPDDDDEALRGTNVFGAYGSIAGHGTTVEPYGFYTRRSATPEVARYDLGTGFGTAGVRLERGLEEAFGYEVELAVQRGETRDRDLGGWMGAGVVRVAPEAWAWDSAARVTFETASGDRDPGDGRVGTWDPLNPARHRHLGRADFVGRRNIRSLKVGWEAFPLRPLRLRVDHVQHWLASRFDAIYETDAETFAAAPAGGFSHGYVGGEVDAILTYDVRANLPVEVGVLRFFPGAAVHEARADATPSTLVYLAVRWTL